MKCSWSGFNDPIPCCLDLTRLKNLTSAEATAQVISAIRLADRNPFSYGKCAAGEG